LVASAETSERLVLFSHYLVFKDRYSPSKANCDYTARLRSVNVGEKIFSLFLPSPTSPLPQSPDFAEKQQTRATKRALTPQRKGRELIIRYESPEHTKMCASSNESKS
jgi:hypothetical protein